MFYKPREWSKEDKDDKTYFQEGFYIFGGMNQKGELKNDIWILQPYYHENKRALSDCTYEYLGRPTLNFVLKKLTDFKGQAPCPRIFHQATKFKNWNNHHFIVIYGGRNDSIFSQT